MIASCQYCHSENLTRDGWYRKAFPHRSTGEIIVIRRQIVECGDCSRTTYLPEGVNLPRPHRRGTATDESIRRRPSVEIPRRIAFYKQSEGITEVRPCCPRCASPRVRRHGREYGFIGKGWWTRRLTESCWKSRWECADCHRYFVTEDRGFLDHRFLREPISDQALRILAGGEEQRTVASAEAEAQSLFDYCERFGPMASTQFGKVRGEIMASKQDREALELMIKGGLLDRAEVHRALAFREKVLREFQRLVEEA